MQISRLEIENYKSLRHVILEPKELTVLVGANASGKSNLAECFEFISETYRHGLEVAVARKGGYENIAHRKIQRSKSSVCIKVTATYRPERAWLPSDIARELESRTIKVEHHFSFVAKGASIKAEFEVEYELLVISVSVEEKWREFMSVVRNGNSVKYKVVNEEELKSIFPNLKHSSSVRYFGAIPDLHFLSERSDELLSTTELAAVQTGRFIPLLRDFLLGIGSSRVFQISPAISRQSGIPTPGPELERTGANLPAVVELLQKRHNAIWQKILQSMRRVLPGLDDIQVNYTTSRTLGLQFHERGVGRPWNVDEISDGTVQTLCLLIAIFDPRNVLLVIEEPENSIHPWVIRNILDACVEASGEKQILLTTHSPVVIDHVPPDKVWVIWRRDGESQLRRLVELDKSALKLWESGEVATFDLLDSGAIPQAIPPIQN